MFKDRLELFNPFFFSQLKKKINFSGLTKVSKNKLKFSFQASSGPLLKEMKSFFKIRDKRHSRKAPASMLNTIPFPLNNILSISIDFDVPRDNVNRPLYQETIYNILQRILPLDRLASFEKISERADYLRTLLPIFKSLQYENDPQHISFFVFSKYRANAFKFFCDVLINWLAPGKRLDVALLYAADVRILELGSNVYTVCELMVRVESREDYEQIQNNLPIIQTEIRLGMDSNYYARRILEVKGLTADAKAALIQEYIAYLISKRPQDFDYDVLTEMQHVMVICRDDFKMARDCRHLSRIISAHYLFRKSLLESVKKSPEKRHLSFKIFRAHVHFPSGARPVLGIIVGLNFLRDKEIFEKRHLLNAVQNLIPSVQAVEHSFFANRRGSENICTLYLELEKVSGENFTGEEIKMLRQELPIDLKDRIEHSMHPIFMPRNEEEIMRNILSLSNQIKYLRDIPQGFISFDEQSHSHLFFTVILVRVLKPDSSSIQERFKNSHSCIEYLHDRCKIIGFLRKKYVKEATVFRLKLPKEPYLRRDHSIDLYKARQSVVLELLKNVGDFRDYNGGMISKQNELLAAVRESLADRYKYNELLLENFFYSISPVIMRALLDPDALKTLFVLLLDSLEKDFFVEKHYLLKVSKTADCVFMVIKTDNKTVKEEIQRACHKLACHSSELAQSYVQVYNIHYFGYAYRCDDPAKQLQFSQTIEMALSAL